MFRKNKNINLNLGESMNYIALLPKEIFQKIMLSLTLDTILNLRKVFSIPNHVIDCGYVWRRKMKLDNLQPLGPRQKSLNYETFKKKYQSAEFALYMYLYKLRQIWLEKPLEYALKCFKVPYTNIEYADEKILVTRLHEQGLDIRNIVTNKLITKVKDDDEFCCILHVNVEFPFLIILSDHGEESLSLESDSTIEEEEELDDVHYKISVHNIALKTSVWSRIFPMLFNGERIFSTNNNMIATWTTDPTKIILIEISTGMEKATLSHHDAIIVEAFLCKNYLLTKTNVDNCLNIWDTDTKVLKSSIDVSSTAGFKFLYNGQAHVILCQKDEKFGYVINLDDCKKHKFKTQTDNIELKFILWRSEVIFCDKYNTLKILDYTTMQYSAKTRVTANSNFIILATLGDIVILDHESSNVLKKFKIMTDCDITNLKALESKLLFAYRDNGEITMCIYDFDVYSHGTKGLSEGLFGGEVPKRISFQMFILSTLVYIIIYVYLINNIFYKYKN